MHKCEFCALFEERTRSFDITYIGNCSLRLPPYMDADSQGSHQPIYKGNGGCSFGWAFASELDA